jgi:hypothetical protein
MKTNIILLRSNAAAPALKMSRANDHKRDRRIERCFDIEALHARARPTLTMIWRTHPTNGRLECRWAVEHGAATDEGVSRTNFLRKAA